RLRLQESFFGELLTVHAVAGPGDGGEALLAHRACAVQTEPVGAVLDPEEGLVDLLDGVALAVVQRIEELAGVGGHGLVGDVLGGFLGGLLLRILGLRELGHQAALLLLQQSTVFLELLFRHPCGARGRTGHWKYSPFLTRTPPSRRRPDWNAG